MLGIEPFDLLHGIGTVLCPDPRMTAVGYWRAVLRGSGHSTSSFLRPNDYEDYLTMCLDRGRGLFDAEGQMRTLSRELHMPSNDCLPTTPSVMMQKF